MKQVEYYVSMHGTESSGTDDIDKQGDGDVDNIIAWCEERAAAVGVDMGYIQALLLAHANECRLVVDGDSVEVVEADKTLQEAERFMREVYVANRDGGEYPGEEDICERIDAWMEGFFQKEEQSQC